MTSNRSSRDYSSHSTLMLHPGPPRVRRIWVLRDGFIEYKVWFIYSWKVIGVARDKVVSFLAAEAERFEAASTGQARRESACDFNSLTTRNPALPPRLHSVEESILNSMGTQLVTAAATTFGDSVGGLAPLAQGDLDTHLRLNVRPRDHILFSPGVLAQLMYEDGGRTNFLFQLAVKNLRRSGAIFYKAIGGHMKYATAFEEAIKELDLEVKVSSQAQDSRDLVLWVPGYSLDKVSAIFDQETINTRSTGLFVPPFDSMCDELWEEIGPVETSDGISLLSASEMENDFVGAG